MEKICICIKNIGVWHSFEKNETATMFFLKKPFLVIYCYYRMWVAGLVMLTALAATNVYSQSVNGK